MRKAIIAAIVATALFAVGAFAAQFTVNAEDVASGRDSVQACAERIDVAFTQGEWDETQKRYEVEEAVFTFLTAAGAASNGCNGLDATWRLELGNQVADDGGTAAVGTTGNFTVNPTPPQVGDIDGWAVADIEGAAVLIEDVLITSNGAPTTLVDPFGDITND